MQHVYQVISDYLIIAIFFCHSIFGLIRWRLLNLYSIITFIWTVILPKNNKQPIKFFRDVIRNPIWNKKIYRNFYNGHLKTLSTDIKKHAKCRHVRLEFNFARLTELFYGDLIWGYLKINHQKILNSLKLKFLPPVYFV